MAFGQAADFVAQYLRQGRLVCVDARLLSRSWVDDDGVRHYHTEVVVNSLQALDCKAMDQ